MGRRTFDFGVSGDYKTNARERWLFAHAEVMQFQPRYGAKALMLRVLFFIGDGNEEIVKQIAKFDTYDMESTAVASLLENYRTVRKRLQKLPFQTCHQRAGKRDWLFRGDLPVSSTDLLTWANWLAEFGVNREEFAQLVENQRETAPL